MEPPLPATDLDIGTRCCTAAYFA